MNIKPATKDQMEEWEWQRPSNPVGIGHCVDALISRISQEEARAEAWKGEVKPLSAEVRRLQAVLKQATFKGYKSAYFKGPMIGTYEITFDKEFGDPIRAALESASEEK